MPNVISFTRVIDWFPHMEHGWGNGYIAISPKHPLYNKKPQSIMDMNGFSIHGGITYDSTASNSLFDHKAHNIPDNYRVIGFDTCHHGDNMRNWPQKKVVEETARLKEWFEKYQ